MPAANKGLQSCQPFWGVWSHRHLIIQLTRRDVLSRYRGSYLGLLWSLLIPLFMLAVYSFVFGVIFKSKWSGDSTRGVGFPLILFCGLVVYNMVGEVCNRSPGLITSNANYVKKVVFPLQVLPVVMVGSAFVNMLIGIVILIFGVLLTTGTLHWALLLTPIVLLPVIFISLGLSWFLASLGTYLQDIGHVVGILVSAGLFLTPIFFPPTAIPRNLHSLVSLNPMTAIVESSREVMVWGTVPNWGLTLEQLAISLVIAGAGYLWFQWTRGGFADVV